MSSDKLLRDLDHIFNITLKNNKSRETVIMFLRKFTEFIDTLIYEVLENMKNVGKIENVPKTPFERANLFVDIVKDNYIKDIIEEYKNARLSLISEYDISGEHRKSIKLIFHTTKGDFEYNIEKIKQLLQMAHDLYTFVHKEWVK